MFPKPEEGKSKPGRKLFQRKGKENPNILLPQIGASQWVACDSPQKTLLPRPVISQIRCMIRSPLGAGLSIASVSYRHDSMDSDNQKGFCRQSFRFIRRRPRVERRPWRPRCVAEPSRRHSGMRQQDAAKSFGVDFTVFGTSYERGIDEKALICVNETVKSTPKLFAASC